METQDTLVFDVRGLRRLGWRHDEVFEMILMRFRGLAVSKSTHRLSVRSGRLLKMRREVCDEKLMVNERYIFGHEEPRQALPGLCTLFQSALGSALSGVLVTGGGCEPCCAHDITRTRLNGCIRLNFFFTISSLSDSIRSYHSFRYCIEHYPKPYLSFCVLAYSGHQERLLLISTPSANSH